MICCVDPISQWHILKSTLREPYIILQHDLLSGSYQSIAYLQINIARALYFPQQGNEKSILRTRSSVTAGLISLIICL